MSKVGQGLNTASHDRLLIVDFSQKLNFFKSNKKNKFGYIWGTLKGFPEFY